MTIHAAQHSSGDKQQVSYNHFEEFRVQM